MSTERVIKKEELMLRKSAFTKLAGNLILTPKSLTYIQVKGVFNKTEEKILEIPISSIVNVKAVKAYAGGTEHLHITYTEGGKELKVTFEHVSVSAAFTMGAASRLEAMYLADWVKAIEDLRGGKNSSNNGLDDLEKLAELKSKGIITQEEFEAKKKSILGL